MALEVFEESTSAADHFQESLARVEVFLMGLEMARERRDPLRQEGNLHLRRTGIRLMLTELFDHRIPRCCCRHGSGRIIPSSGRIVKPMSGAHHLIRDKEIVDQEATCKPSSVTLAPLRSR